MMYAINHVNNNDKECSYGDNSNIIGVDCDQLNNESVVVVQNENNNDTNAVGVGVVVNVDTLDDSMISIGNNISRVNTNNDMDTNDTEESHDDGTNPHVAVAMSWGGVNHQNSDNGDEFDDDMDHDEPDDDYDDDDDDDDECSSYDSINDDEPLRQAMRREKPVSDILELIHFNPKAIEEAHNDSGDYPIHLACNNRDYGDVVMTLIDLYPAAVHEANLMGQYPLHIALKFRQHEFIIMKLIETCPIAVQEEDIEDDDDDEDYPLQYYPLHLAIMYHPYDNVILKLLDIFPAAASIRTERYGFTLNIACSQGKSVAIIKKLIELYPIALQETTSMGCYPLNCVFYDTHTPNDIIKLVFDSYPSAMEQQNEIGNTPLHSSIHHLGNIDENVLEYMIQHSSIDNIINVRNREGYTPLHYACQDACTTTHMIRPEIINLKIELIDKYFLKHPNIDVNTSDNDGTTPLHKAADSGCLLLAQKLLDHPCISINIRNHDSRTPLELVKRNFELNLLSGVTPQLIEWVQILSLLIEFPSKRRWQAYQYFFK